MEIFSNLPEELQGVVMSYTRGMWNATPAQLRLFKTCEPRHQQVVLAREYCREVRHHPLTMRCKFEGWHCPLRFSFYGFFTHPDAIEEYPHYRKHGMCSKCKQEEARQAARRQERLDGLARFQQAFRDDDYEAMLENEHWCSVDSLYDRCLDWPDYWEQRYPWEYE